MPRNTVPDAGSLAECRGGSDPNCKVLSRAGFKMMCPLEDTGAQCNNVLDWRYFVKILLAVLGCLSLCSCELSPASRESADDIPLHPQFRSGLADPRNYMDKDDPNLQKLISSPYVH